MPLRNLAVWFEIPVADFDRSLRFFKDGLGLDFRIERRAATTRAVIVRPGSANGGALVLAPERAGAHGTTVFLQLGESLEPTLRRCTAAGAVIDTPVTELGCQLGCIAVIRDPDGNRIGLHAASPTATQS